MCRKLYRKKRRAQFNESHVLKLRGVSCCIRSIMQRITIKVACAVHEVCALSVCRFTWTSRANNGEVFGFWFDNRSELTNSVSTMFKIVQASS